jgi:hypothetical protein
MAIVELQQIEPQHIELQHINVKLLLKNEDAQAIDLDPVIPVFHSWIQQQVADELLLDVADYRHVQAGPGIVLIGHEADYSLDNAENRLGVRYNRKAILEGNNQDRLTQAARSALAACQRLQQDTRLNQKLNFNGQDIEIFINDRLQAPNTAATREAVRTEFDAFAKKLFGGSQYALSFGSESSSSEAADPRRLFATFLHAARPFTTEDLINNLKFAPPAADSARSTEAEVRSNG